MSPRGRSRTNKEPKRKAVKIRLAIRQRAGKITEPYQIMEGVITTERKELAGLRIGIAWHTGWRPDADGVKTHGKCLKRSDLDRSLDGYDAVIVLNEKSWLAFGASDKLRLITHELEHLQIASDKNGEPLIDDKGRQVIRMKRHDVADFASIIQKFGLPPCLTDVQIADAARPLLKLAEEKAAIVPQKEEIPLKFKGLRSCSGKIIVMHGADGWRAGYNLEIGNLATQKAPDGMSVVTTRLEAIQTAKSGMQCWAEDLDPSGTPAAQKDMKNRLVKVCDQIDEQLDPILNAAEEFAEDHPENKGKDADGDEDQDI